MTEEQQQQQPRPEQQAQQAPLVDPCVSPFEKPLTEKIERGLSPKELERRSNG
jgi:hypothetical protein